MRLSVIIIAVIMISGSLASAQTPGYHVIFGNHDGSTVDVNIGDLIELRVWVATPSFFDLNGDSVQDTINLVYIPLGTNDSVITSREDGVAYFPFINWDYQFTDPGPHYQNGYTNQCFIAGPPLYGWWSPLITYEDTINVLSFFMRTAADSSLIGNTVCPIIAGNDSANGGVLWGILDGITPIIPSQIFSCLYFVEYLAGDANGSGIVDGIDVLYLTAFFKGFGAPPDPLLAGDANGDCEVNGLDIDYLINYFKGFGETPYYGDCH